VIVFDAGVLIAHLDPDDVFHRAATEFLEENEELDFATSALTLAECLIRPTRVGRATSVLGAFDRLHLLTVDVTAADAAGIAEVRAVTGLRMPDAIVLYTAERAASELASTDAGLIRAAAARGVVAHRVGGA
jgi:predicted nucleic acid-binding protein